MRFGAWACAASACLGFFCRSYGRYVAVAFAIYYLLETRTTYFYRSCCCGTIIATRWCSNSSGRCCPSANSASSERRARIVYGRVNIHRDTRGSTCVVEEGAGEEGIGRAAGRKTRLTSVVGVGRADLNGADGHPRGTLTRDVLRVDADLVGHPRAALAVGSRRRHDVRSDVSSRAAPTQWRETSRQRRGKLFDSISRSFPTSARTEA